MSLEYPEPVRLYSSRAVSFQAMCSSIFLTKTVESQTYDIAQLLFNRALRVSFKIVRHDFMFCEVSGDELDGGDEEPCCCRCNGLFDEYEITRDSLKSDSYR